MGVSNLEPAGALFLTNFWDTVLLNMTGVLVCLYSLHVKTSKERDANYRAYCDFNEYMSCSRVLTSKYSQGFGFMHLLLGKNHALNSRNCSVGLAVYTANIVMCFVLPTPICSSILYSLTIVMVIGCFYLAFILFIVLKDLCVVCVATYIINGCLLYLTREMYAAHH